MAPVKYRLTASTGFGSQDIDLFVGRDGNSNSLPAESEEVCRSTTSSTTELCDIVITSETSTRAYWVMVQNYSGPGTNVRVDSVLLPLSVSSTSPLVSPFIHRRCRLRLKNATRPLANVSASDSRDM